jgi:hypothetical protein
MRKCIVRTHAVVLTPLEGDQGDIPDNAYEAALAASEQHGWTTGRICLYGTPDHPYWLDYQDGPEEISEKHAVRMLHYTVSELDYVVSD